jgi:hypothetical protein
MLTSRRARGQVVIEKLLVLCPEAAAARNKVRRALARARLSSREDAQSRVPSFCDRRQTDRTPADVVELEDARPANSGTSKELIQLIRAWEVRRARVGASIPRSPFIRLRSSLEVAHQFAHHHRPPTTPSGGPREDVGRGKARRGGGRGRLTPEVCLHRPNLRQAWVVDVPNAVRLCIRHGIRNTQRFSTIRLHSCQPPLP